MQKNPNQIIAQSLENIKKDLAKLDFPELSEISKAKIDGKTFYYNKGVSYPATGFSAIFEKDSAEIRIDIIVSVIKHQNKTLSCLT